MADSSGPVQPRGPSAPSVRGILRRSIEKTKEQEARLSAMQTADPATQARLEKVKAQLLERRRTLETDLAIREQYYASSQRDPVSALEATDPEKALAQAHGPGRVEIERRIELRHQFKALKQRRPELYKLQVGGNFDYEGYTCIEKCQKPTVKALQEKNLRDHIADGIKKINSSDCHGGSRFLYPHNTKDREFQMPPSQWVPTRPNGRRPGQSTSMEFRTKPGTKASDAINGVFSGPECPAVVECLTAMHLVYYRAVLNTVGPKKFDEMFPKGISISTSGDESNQFIKSECKDSASDLKKGDWVYFYNNSNYLNRHPPTNFNNAFQGENAVVVGKDQYEGFGVPRSTEAAMKGELLSAYNTAPRKRDPRTGDWVLDSETARLYPQITRDKIPGLFAPPTYHGQPARCAGKIGPVVTPNVDNLP